MLAGATVGLLNQLQAIELPDGVKKVRIGTWKSGNVVSVSFMILAVAGGVEHSGSLPALGWLAQLDAEDQLLYWYILLSR